MGTIWYYSRGFGIPAQRTRATDAAFRQRRPRKCVTVELDPPQDLPLYPTALVRPPGRSRCCAHARYRRPGKTGAAEGLQLPLGGVQTSCAPPPLQGPTPLPYRPRPPTPRSRYCARARYRRPGKTGTAAGVQLLLGGVQTSCAPPPLHGPTLLPYVHLHGGRAVARRACKTLARPDRVKDPPLYPTTLTPLLGGRGVARVRVAGDRATQAPPQDPPLYPTALVPLDDRAVACARALRATGRHRCRRRSAAPSRGRVNLLRAPAASRTHASALPPSSTPGGRAVARLRVADERAAQAAPQFCSFP
ncbi:hypothetical protein FIBSPDRAFT_967158 [Athelia psychrophila]|uniref:Uncharacterized protein n=1 Tax=Athelia psychrophila TaxID=1759441 RepID=A0A167W0J6_9AGAM|nr:hypothetical protein FIBSPDRAFT_967158 [Fibularhizoctonia sp. CBS 109695]